MNTSNTIKVLLAVFLGAFLWIVIVSIQTPQHQPSPDATQELREELLTRAQDVVRKVGNVTITASVEETYRSGEIHFQNFTMVREDQNRTLTITGRTAQTRPEGSKLAFIEMEGDLRVETTDGLDLSTSTLNYESAQERVFSNDPCTFTINELRGRSDRFIYFVDTHLLELSGAVRCRMTVEDEDGNARGRANRVNFFTDNLVYDQSGHTVDMNGNARVAQAGSYVLGERILGNLTDDNRQFTGMTVFSSTVLHVPTEEPEEQKATGAKPENISENGEGGEETSEPDPKSTLSHHAGGIKNLRCRTLKMEFATGDENVLRTVVAEGEASLDIAPTALQRAAGRTEVKNINGERITARLEETGKGIERIQVNGGSERARVHISEQRPKQGGKRVRSAPPKKSEPAPPRTMLAQEFDAQVDPETNAFTEVRMTRNAEFTRGDMIVTGNSIRHVEAEQKLYVSGRPVLRDKFKRVSGRDMVVSLDIGDLAAEGDVESLFYSQAEPDSEDPGVFTIGIEGGETSIAAGSLRFDYRNHVLRYAGGVRVTQGRTTIISRNLDIDQDEQRLNAYGEVNANLQIGKSDGEDSSVDAAEQPAADAPAGQEQEDEETKGKRRKRDKGERREDNKRDSSIFALQGERLQVDKKRNEIRVVQNARAAQQEMNMTAKEIRYDLAEDGSVVKSTALREVRVDVATMAVFGDKAEFFVEEQLLLVTGRSVRYVDKGRESTHGALAYDMKTGTITFDARADQLIKTRISN